LELCVDLLNRALEPFRRKSGLLLVEGRPETYPEGVAFQIAAACLTRKMMSKLAIVVVNDSTDFALSIFNALGIDLGTLSSRGDALLESVGEISKVSQLLRGLPGGSLAVVDSTAGPPRDADPESLSDLFSLARLAEKGKSSLRVLFLVNPDTWNATPLAFLEELADATIRLNAVAPPGAADLSRYLEIVYTRGHLTPYTRIYYTVTRGGVEFTSMREV